LFRSIMLAAAAMAAALWLWLSLLGNGTLAALLAIAAGMAVYFGAAWALHSEETGFAVNILRSKLLRRGLSAET
ncbi:MAG: hypothetical protein M1434_01855, partial [Chloroflexi bacterium]|nr:hypothetical protein [Chloroflexota bacterium]